MGICLIDKNADIDGADGVDTHLCTEHLSEEQFQKVTDNKDNLWQLFPHGWFTVAWEPYQAIPSNFQNISREVQGIVATRNMTDRDPSSYIALSFGHGWAVKKGYLYQIDFYGKNELLIVEHFLKHVTVAREYAPTEDLYFNVHFPDHIDKDFMHSYFALQPKTIKILHSHEVFVTTLAHQHFSISSNM